MLCGVEDLLGGLLTYFVSTMLYIQGMVRGEKSRLPTIKPKFRSRRQCHLLCTLSLLLALSFAARGFSPGPLVFPSPQKLAFSNSSSVRNGRRRITM